MKEEPLFNGIKKGLEEAIEHTELKYYYIAVKTFIGLEDVLYWDGKGWNDDKKSAWHFQTKEQADGIEGSTATHELEGDSWIGPLTIGKIPHTDFSEEQIALAGEYLKQAINEEYVKNLQEDFKLLLENYWYVIRTKGGYRIPKEWDYDEQWAKQLMEKWKDIVI